MHHPRAVAEVLGRSCGWDPNEHRYDTVRGGREKGWGSKLGCRSRIRLTYSISAPSDPSSSDSSGSVSSSSASSASCDNVASSRCNFGGMFSLFSLMFSCPGVPPVRTSSPASRRVRHLRTFCIVCDRQSVEILRKSHHTFCSGVGCCRVDRARRNHFEKGGRKYLYFIEKFGGGGLLCAFLVFTALSAGATFHRRII